MGCVFDEVVPSPTSMIISVGCLWSCLTVLMHVGCARRLEEHLALVLRGRQGLLGGVAVAHLSAPSGTALSCAHALRCGRVEAPTWGWALWVVRRSPAPPALCCLWSSCSHPELRPLPRNAIVLAGGRCIGGRCRPQGGFLESPLSTDTQRPLLPLG